MSSNWLRASGFICIGFLMLKDSQCNFQALSLADSCHGTNCMCSESNSGTVTSIVSGQVPIFVAMTLTEMLHEK